jgi:hypothetical protein
MEYFLRECCAEPKTDASSQNILEDDCSDSFAAEISELYDSLIWTSPNYKLVSEYANSMSFSDSDTAKLLVLVSPNTS